MLTNLKNSFTAGREIDFQQVAQYLHHAQMTSYGITVSKSHCTTQDRLIQAHQTIIILQRTQIVLAGSSLESDRLPN